MMPKLHTVGRVAGRHGYNGEVSLLLNRKDVSEHIKKGNFLFIEFDGKGVPFLIEQFRRSGAIIKLADISSEKDAEELEGRIILLENSGDGSSSTDSDLIGFMIFNADDQMIGTILNIEEFPAGPMFVVDCNGNEILIPFTEDWFIEIDAKNKKISLDIPEGLTDL